MGLAVFQGTIILGYVMSLFSNTVSNNGVINSPIIRAPFIRLEHYLQECGAELPHQCPATKKALNQSCMFDTDCVWPATCQEAKCQCRKGYFAYKESCERARGLGEQCIDGQCRPPFICTIRDVCQCPPTMQRSDGVCDPRCPDDQMLVEGLCLPTVRLHGKCNSTLQCQNAFAYCKEGTCKCVKGTKASTDRCIASATCPDGQDPLKDSNENVKCNSRPCAVGQLPASPTGVKLDSCPTGSYCVFPSYQDGDGFCCPERPYCPIGEPMRGKNCINPRNEAERCPAETHHCYAAARGTFCCPLPCPSLAATLKPVVVSNGICYEKKGLNENCTVSAQCPQAARCANETCECGPGYKVRIGQQGEARCQMDCSSGYVLVGTDCLPLVLPFEKCTHSAQCTADTKCISEQCQCPCGTTFYGGKCIDMPECPNFGRGAYDPVVTSRGALVECSPNDFSLAPCPEKSFCYRAAVYSGGVCCPLPEPTCSNRDTPPRGRHDEPIICDITETSRPSATCPRNLYCYDFTAALLPGLGQSAGRRGVCCPLDVVTQPLVAGYSRLYHFRSPLLPQWTQASNLQTDLCSNGRRPNLSGNGQPMRCPYNAYEGQCGPGSTCELHPVADARFAYNEGVCCT